MARTHEKKLTKKQKAFLTEYQKDYNATRSAIAVGYSEKYAGELGYQLLQKTPVKQALEKAQEDRLKKVGVHAERVLTEIARIGLSDTRKLFDAQNNLLPASEWPDDVAAAVADLEVMDLFEGRGPEKQRIGYLKKVKQHDKVKALDILAKHLKLYPEVASKLDLDIHGDISMTNLELSAKIIYLLKVAFDCKKQLGQREQGPAEEIEAKSEDVTEL